MTTENKQNRGEWTSASNAEADSRCPGRHLYQKGLSEPPSDAAAFGTVVHEAFAGDDVDTTIQQDNLLEMAREREGKVLAKFPGDYTKIVETRFWSHRSGLKHSGQPDVVFVSLETGHAVIEDLKSLRGTVPDASRNMQLADLAALAYIQYPVESITVFINQPMVKGATVMTTYNASQLQDLVTQMWERVKASNTPHAPRVAGEVQCQYCRARGICPESIAWLEKTSTALVTKAENYKEMVARIAPETLAEIHRKAKTVVSILEAVKNRLKGLPEDELDKLGLELRPGFQKHTISDNEALLARLLESHKLPSGAVIPHMKMTKKALEDLLRGLLGIKGKELDETMKRLTDGITEATTTEAQLVWKKE